MTGKDSIDVTLAHVDPTLVSCWDKMVKQGEECSLHLKHSKGKVIATLQCTRTVKPPTLSLSPSPSAKEKKKKRKGGKKKLEKLLAYHQRLVEEKGLPPSRLMEEHAASSPAPSTQVTSEKRFKCINVTLHQTRSAVSKFMLAGVIRKLKSSGRKNMMYPLHSLR